MLKHRRNSVRGLALVLAALTLSLVPFSGASASRITPTPDGGAAVAATPTAGDSGSTPISPRHTGVSTSALGTGIVDGTVTYLGSPVTTGCAYLFDLTFADAGSGCMNGSGYFSISGLAPGDYYVEVRGVTGAADTWYGDVQLWTDTTAATVSNGATTTANIAMLGQGGTVSGTLTVTGTTPVFTGTYAQVYTDHRIYVAEDEMDASGHFTITGVAAGTYRVRFVNVPGVRAFWRSNAPEIVPTTVVVGGASGWAVTGVNDTASNTADLSTFSGVLRVPQGWTSPTVCVAALKEDYYFYSAYCGSPGEYFDLDSFEINKAYYLVFTDGVATTDPQFFTWVTGGQTQRWFGNAATVGYASYFLLPTSGSFWVNVYFFNDVDNTSPFFDNISWMADRGVTTGYADGTFRPLANVSRQAMAAFMYRFAGSPAYTPPVTSPFNDVATDSAFYPEVCWMADQGISTGYADGGFHPLANVSRQAMAAFMYRFAGSPAFTPPVTSPFNDFATTAPFYMEVTWMADTGISTGYADGGFHPAANVSRQAMAAFMNRLDTLLAPA